MQPLNIFYDEPDPDRWFPLDHYPRRLIRRVIRGKPHPGGHMRVFLNLCAGLDRVGVSYRVNDYRFLRQHPREIACVIGKDYLLDERKWKNPVILGPAIFSHPVEQPDFFIRYPAVKRIVVPCEWVREMWQPAFGDKVTAWPVGIDTDRWKPARDKELIKKRITKKNNTENAATPRDTPSSTRQMGEEVTTDFLIYDKVRWEHEQFEPGLIEPIKEQLRHRDLSFSEIRYGYYEEEDFESLLRGCKAMIFLCEHETQGIAYQQALSCGVPILAWDRGGFWQDPKFYPGKIQFQPVSAVPYWDDRCGVRFSGMEEFSDRLDEFLRRVDHGTFAPRDYILENLTLEKCAHRYVEHHRQVEEGLQR